MSIEEQLKRYRDEQSDQYGSAFGPEVVAPGRAADYKQAVVYRGDHETLEDGVARAVRSHAKALDGAGVPVSLHSISHTVRHPETGLVRAMDDLINPEVHRQVGHLRYRTVRSIALTIHHAVVSSGAQLEALVVPREVRFDGGERHLYRRAIVYLAWERTTVHESLVDVIGRCAALWVPCERNRKVFVAAGVPAERVAVVPHPFDPAGEVAKLAASPKGCRAPKGCGFYSIGKWEPRKNHHALIGAFLRTFSRDFCIRCKVRLTLKTSSYGKWDEYPASPQESVELWLQEPVVQQNGWTLESLPAALTLITSMISEDRLAKLHALHNVYVSASHAEGFDLPAFDAKVMGNALVYVPFGGPEDFAEPTDTPVELLGTEPVPAGYGWEAGAQWAFTSVGRLEGALRAASQRTLRLQNRTRERSPSWDRRFSEEAVGRLMADKVLEIARTVEPDAHSDFAERVGAKRTAADWATVDGDGLGGGNG